MWWAGEIFAEVTTFLRLEYSWSIYLSYAVILVWFGLYICPDKPKPINIGWAKENGCPLIFRLACPRFFFSSAMVWTQNLNTEAWTQRAAMGGWNELEPSCVQICVQSKRKSSCDLVRNCLIFKGWSHLGLNQGLPDYESGALTNWAIGPFQHPG